MTKRFGIFGPFDFDKRQFASVGADQKQIKKDFWLNVDSCSPGLAAAIGLYVFFITHGSNDKPWYVGKTCAVTGFKGEIFQPHKSEIYKGFSTVAGQARFYFFPLLTGTGRFSKSLSTSKKTIEMSEKTVIALASRRNPKLANIKDKKTLSGIYIPGVMGSQAGQPSADSRRAKALLVG